MRGIRQAPNWGLAIGHDPGVDVARSLWRWRDEQEVPESESSQVEDQVADVAELADALDSKSSTRESVWVRPPPSAPKSLAVTR
jgi:hypothetical protein